MSSLLVMTAHRPPALLLTEATAWGGPGRTDGQGSELCFWAKSRADCCWHLMGRAHTCTHACTHTHTHTHAHVYARTCTHTLAHACLHTHARICTHTHSRCGERFQVTFLEAQGDGGFLRGHPQT